MSRTVIILISFLALGLIGPQLMAQNVDSRRAQLIGVIDEELREVARINKQSGSRNPELMLRMAELLLEKARLIKEQENTKFLKLSPNDRKKVNRGRFFSKSRAYFQQAQKTCEYIIKRFKNFDEKGDVYYIMAYNAKEFQQEGKAKRYFDLAVKNSRPGTMTRTRSEIALAEIYYNDNNYARAIPLYERALLSSKDKERWWTKDAYNLAWSYFRQQDYDKAINLLERVEKLSANKKFIDMRDSVERDKAYFYTEAGRTDEAVALFKREGGDISKNLLRVGKNLVNQGKFAAAAKSFEEALKNTSDPGQKTDINIELISLYERFGQPKKHLRSAQALFKDYQNKKLNREQVKVLRYQVGRMGAILQKQATSDTYDSRPKIKEEKGRHAVAYFEIMAEMDPKTAHRSTFHAGETLFAIGDVDKALVKYDSAVELSNKRKDKKTFDLALQGMMMSLDSDSLSSSIEERYLEKAFRLHLARNPGEKNNSKIYQRLFNIFYEKNDIQGAQKTLLAFKKDFPNEKGPQEAMVAKIMSYHQEKKDVEALRKWARLLESGQFKVSPKYLETVRLTLLNLEFEDVESFNTKGEKKKALKGYLEIYKHPSSTEEAKKNAAYNISTLFFELGNVEFTHRWALNALEKMEAKDVLEYEESFLSFGNDFFSRRRFDKASDIYEKTLIKICRDKAKNKDLFFKNAVVVNLAEGNTEKASQLTQTAYRCNVSNSKIAESQLSTLKLLADRERWSEFNDYFREVENSRELWPELIHPLSRLQDALENVGRVDEAKALNNRILNYYEYSTKKNLQVPIEGLNVVADLYMRDVRREASTLANMQLSFPEERYNKTLEEMFAQLDRFTEAALRVLDTGSGEGIVSAYRELVEEYDRFAKKVYNFTPPDKSDEYISSFKAAMKDVVAPIANKSREFKNEAVRQIKNSKILASDNSFFLRDLNIPLDIQYHPAKGAVLMDRGGRK